MSSIEKMMTALLGMIGMASAGTLSGMAYYTATMGKYPVARRSGPKKMAGEGLAGQEHEGGCSIIFRSC
ncbi:hypothetical protein KI810_03305 [Geobacter luticola]|uniref:Uncharacterized protein n=1 Tax=Geomobilimonas luticola TaxID=1114878 RepID=A0ABS5S9L0_9BACT|nr:hypothetical protein [Geomobilimonas luticola]